MSGPYGRARGRLVRFHRVGLARFGVVLLGLIGAIVAGELTLQAMSLVAGQYANRTLDAAAGGDGIRVLGDSHTYGLPLPEHESYPAQLEARLSRMYPGRSVEVVNLGIPGLNSEFVSHRLERQLYQLNPDLIVVWVGINNLWNVIERDRWRSDDSLIDLRRGLMWSRLFRLASIAWYSATGHQNDPRERGGWYEGELPPSGRLAAGVDLPNPAPGLAHDLEAMSVIAAAVDTPIIFVTYPMRSQRPISRVIEATGG